MTSVMELAERRVSSVALEATSGGKLPTRVLLVPWGEVVSEHGAFVMDDEAAKLTIAAFESHGTDLPIDYEHQTLGGQFSSPSGQAPAAGWIKRIEARAPSPHPDPLPGGEGEAAGLWADVEWTEPAREQLAARQYRYLSPVALVRGDDRRMVGLHSAALTNKPAIVAMRPVVNKAGDVWEELRGAVYPPMRRGVFTGGETQEELAAGAVARIRDLTSQLARRTASELVSQALASGKLLPSQRPWAEQLVRQNQSAFETWLEEAPVVVAAGRTRGPSGERDVRREAIAARARAEYRAAGRFISGICTEEAFVADAVKRMAKSE